jgi:hypothetical protein
MKHVCEAKKRVSQMLSPIGQAAFGYYNTWFKLKKLSQQSSATFLESRYFKSMIKFAEFIVKTNIGKPEKYIELMVDGGVNPSLWCAAGAYDVYIAWLDKVNPQEDQVQESLSYLLDICEKEGVALADIAKYLGPQRIISITQQKRLSPWVVFRAKSFLSEFKTWDKAHRVTYGRVSDAESFVKRFEKDPDMTRRFDALFAEFGL